ncbi:MAG: hypothetical protein DMG58_00770 [Acidobacteria bacterium]|nr:MAG: hypothetical protein DMG58_00770 [Acidobacteriota bacterium]
MDLGWHGIERQSYELILQHVLRWLDRCALIASWPAKARAAYNSSERLSKSTAPFFRPGAN